MAEIAGQKAVLTALHPVPKLAVSGTEIVAPRQCACAMQAY
jgi:hypothetical protein